MCLLFNVENALVRKGEEVRLLDTGKFKVKNLKPKIGRNPKTGEKVEIPARKKIVFVPSALLNNALNEGGF